VSLATLENTGVDRTFIKASQQMKIDTRDTPRARAALLTVLDAACQFRAQLIDIDDDRKALMPLQIVHGVATEHPKDAYAIMLRKAFPEYCQGDHKMKGVLSVNDLWHQLFLKHFAKHGPRAGADEQPAQIELHKYVLFLPDEARRQENFAISPKEKEEAVMLRGELAKAAAGDADALKALQFFAKAHAMGTAKDMKQKGILEKTRFFQIGLHREEFRQCERYTYLESFGLRDTFVAMLQRFFREPHNVCVKTPNVEPAPAFADITTTFLEDVRDILHHLQTGETLKKRHVFARKR